MATADQIKSLIRTHIDDQSEQFYTAALQIAAHEAMNGHSSLAHEIRTTVMMDTGANKIPRRSPNSPKALDSCT